MAVLNGSYCINQGTASALQLFRGLGGDVSFVHKPQNGEIPQGLTPFHGRFAFPNLHGGGREGTWDELPYSAPHCHVRASISLPSEYLWHRRDFPGPPGTHLGPLLGRTEMIPGQISRSLRSWTGNVAYRNCGRGGWNLRPPNRCALVGMPASSPRAVAIAPPFWRTWPRRHVAKPLQVVRPTVVCAGRPLPSESLWLEFPGP